LLTAAVLIALLAIVVSQGSAPPAQALFGDSDGDSVIDFAEVITGSNPNDAHSTPEDNFPDVILQTNLCSDGLDNDGDGLTDGADSGCVDSDNDIVSNQTEAILGSNPNSSDSFPEDARMDAVLQWLGFGFAQACNDGNDNDADGLIDSADDGCPAPMLHDSDAFDDLTEKLFGSDPFDANSVPEHETANPGSCSDRIDNDGDGLTDGADPGCAPLTNDNADQATMVGALPFEDSVNVNSAGLEPGEPHGSCIFNPQLSVWYRYTAATDGAITADTAGSNFTTAIAAYTRAGAAYTEVSCAPIVPNRALEAVGAHATIHVTAGETYYIQTIGYIFPGLPNKLRILIDTAHPPSNDSFASPRVVTSLPFSERLNTTDATREVGEPMGRCVYNQPNASVWYRFTAASDSVLIANTRGSSYSTATTAWTDSQFGLAEVGCTNYDPRVAFPVEAGRTYYVQVSSQDPSGGGALHFALTENEPPGNDDFADATNVSSLPFEDSVDTFTATRELGEPMPTCGYNQFATTVWYKTTAQQTGYLKASAEVSQDSPGVILGAYHGSSPSDLTELACAYPYGYESTAAVPVTAGETYYFQVGTPYYGGGKFVPTLETPEAAGFNAETGVVTFHLETLVIPSCAPSQFTFSDPMNDQRGGFGPPPPGPDAPPDITSLSGGSDGTNLCVRVQFAGPLPARSEDPRQYVQPARIEFDTDENIDTGYYSQLRYQCGSTLGADVSGSFTLRGDVLVPLDVSFPIPIPVAGASGFPPQEQTYGFVTYGEQSLQFIVPLAAIGGDDHLRLAFAAFSTTGYDCVPDDGVVVSPHAPAPGDVNCDGATNSLDSTLILQRFAGLLYQALPCGYVGDVNQNGGVGPIDAVLILQYNAGMISQFSPSG
jgi:hypothetical protein